jgi:DNA-binding MarR family transcriptional regulator
VTTTGKSVASARTRKRPPAQAVADAGVTQTPSADGDDPLDLGVLNDLLGFRFRRIQNHLARAFEAEPRHGNLRSGVFSILALISANPGVSQARLALEAGIDKTSLVALLDHLEKEGWAVRVRAKDDRRKHSLHITDPGLTALQRLTDAAHEIEAAARSSLTSRQLAELMTILDKLYARCFREQEL